MSAPKEYWISKKTMPLGSDSILTEYPGMAWTNYKHVIDFDAFDKMKNDRDAWRRKWEELESAKTSCCIANQNRINELLSEVSAAHGKGLEEGLYNAKKSANDLRNIQQGYAALEAQMEKTMLAYKKMQDDFKASKDALGEISQEKNIFGKPTKIALLAKEVLACLC